MRRIVNNFLYDHRGVALVRMDEYGGLISTDLDDALFKTFADARRYVDKWLDGTHDREPVVVDRVYRIMFGDKD